MLESAGAQLLEADVRDPKSAVEALSFKPQLIFHLAAQIDVRKSVEDPGFDADVNLGGLIRMLEVASETGARFINTASGGAMFGELDGKVEAITEQATTRPKSPYGISKRAGEDYLRFFADHHGVDFVSLAHGNVFGPRQDPHGEAGVVAIFIGKLLDSQHCVIYGDGKQTRDYVYVGDVIDAYLLAMDGGTNETFNIATGVETTVLELYEAISAEIGVSIEGEFGPERPGEAARVRLDISKAEAQLGWSPGVSLEEGIRLTVDSMRSRG